MKTISDARQLNMIVRGSDNLVCYQSIENVQRDSIVCGCTPKRLTTMVWARPACNF